MDTNAAIGILSALAQPTRFRVVTTLSQAFPKGMPVGELANLVDVPQNTMSSHLAILSRAGLVLAQRSGRIVKYSASENMLRDLAELLLSHSPGPTAATGAAA